MAKLKHIVFVIPCGILTLFVLPRLNLEFYAGMGFVDEPIAELLLGGILLFHLFGLFIGMLFTRISVVSAIIVCVVCLIPLGALSAMRGAELYHMKYTAPSDRFRYYLADPIPKSVSNIKFVPLSEKYAINLVFRFSIAPDDLAKIIADKGFKEVGETGFRRPDDLFTHEEYLPLEGKPTYYQATDEYGNELTLKVSEDRRFVVFRRESESFYRDKGWNLEVYHDGEVEFLAELKKRAKHGR